LAYPIAWDGPKDAWAFPRGWSYQKAKNR